MCQTRENPASAGFRYYGYYSNVSRGKRKKQDLDDIIPSILEPEGSSKAFRKNWARLIQKIYETAIRPEAIYVVVTLSLTHKGNFSIVLPRKSNVLSNQKRKALVSVMGHLMKMRQIKGPLRRTLN